MSVADDLPDPPPGHDSRVRALAERLFAAEELSPDEIAALLDAG